MFQAATRTGFRQTRGLGFRPLLSVFVDEVGLQQNASGTVPMLTLKNGPKLGAVVRTMAPALPPFHQ